MLTYYLTLILLVSYIWGSGLYKETWSGWSFDGLCEWGEFASVAIPSLAMTYVFWLCTEIGTFLAGKNYNRIVINIDINIYKYITISWILVDEEQFQNF